MGFSSTASSTSCSSTSDNNQTNVDQPQQPQVKTSHDASVVKVGRMQTIFPNRSQFIDWVPSDNTDVVIPRTSDFFTTTKPFLMSLDRWHPGAQVVLSEACAERLRRYKTCNDAPLASLIAAEDVVGFSSIQFVSTSRDAEEKMVKVLVVRYGSDDELSEDYQYLYSDLFVKALPHEWFKDRFNVGPFAWCLKSGRIQNVGTNVNTQKPTLWHRIIVTTDLPSETDPNQDENVESICHEYVCSKTGEIVGSAHLDIKERTLYRYVRFDEEKTRVWNRICAAESNANSTSFWPRAKRTKFGKVVFDNTSMYRGLEEDVYATVYETPSPDRSNGNMFVKLGKCNCSPCTDTRVLTWLDKYHLMNVISDMLCKISPKPLPCSSVPSPVQPSSTIVSSSFESIERHAIDWSAKRDTVHSIEHEGTSVFYTDSHSMVKNIMGKPSGIVTSTQPTFMTPAPNTEGLVLETKDSPMPPQPVPNTSSIQVPPGNSMDVTTNTNIGVADKPSDAAVQPPPVVKNPKLVVDSITFSASIHFQGNARRPISEHYSLDHLKSGYDVDRLLAFLKSWNDGSYFDENSILGDGRVVDYSFSDMEIKWRFVNESTEIPPKCTVKTQTIVGMGMKTDSGFYSSETIKTPADVQLFYDRIHYMISILKNLV